MVEYTGGLGRVYELPFSERTINWPIKALNRIAQKTGARLAPR